MNECVLKARQDLVELRVIRDDLINDKPNGFDKKDFFLWQRTYYLNKSAMCAVKSYLELLKESE